MMTHINEDKQLYFIAGLPRSGSTLLTAILGQNPAIHTEGTSALCQLMWDTEVSCEQNSFGNLKANNRLDFTKDAVISAIPKAFYSNTDKPIVFDKCRAWTTIVNLDLIKRYITPNPKVVVLWRPIDEIMASFAKVQMNNNVKTGYYDKYFTVGSDPLMHSFEGAKFAAFLGGPEFLFVSYDELVSDPEATVRKIYTFCELEYFEHTFSNLACTYTEQDEYHENLLGLHDVRPTIEKVRHDVVLPEHIQKVCDRMTQELLTNMEA